LVTLNASKKYVNISRCHPNATQLVTLANLQ
jgi:hypothetical protein